MLIFGARQIPKIVTGGGVLTSEVTENVVFGTAPIGAADPRAPGVKTKVTCTLAPGAKAYGKVS